MLPRDLSDFDSLWDYADPAGSEAKFRELIPRIPETNPAHLELLTQIARALGLQRKFTEAHDTLDQIRQRIGVEPSIVQVRHLLERGRVFNSSGQTAEARPLFEQALAVAKEIGADNYAVDAIHMLANISPPNECLRLNHQAIDIAEASTDEKARKWLGSLYNNLGWGYHGLGDYAAALDAFKKAETWQRSQGRAAQTRIAVWCVARTLRSLERMEEALTMQTTLLEELESAEEEDSYVFEEIGECLLALGRNDEARPYFGRAFDVLSKDEVFREQEPERLTRLRELANSE